MASEVQGEHETRQVVAEAAWWEFNRYGDWFDTDYCFDPLPQSRRYKLAARCSIAERSISAQPSHSEFRSI